MGEVDRWWEGSGRCGSGDGEKVKNQRDASGGRRLRRMEGS